MELEWGVRVLNAEDSPTEEDSSGLKFQQTFAKLGVNGISISRLAFDSKGEVSG